MAVELSIIVVSFNTRKMTLACLRSIFEETKDVAFEVIMVDNASGDDSAGAAAELFPAVQIIRSSENVGFARANNIGTGMAVGDYILLLNPDTVVMDGAIDKLLAFAKASPEAGIWGGRTVFENGTLNPSSCWRRMTLWNQLCRAIGVANAFVGSPLFNSESYGGWRRENVREVDIVSGCFFLIRRQLWERLKGFDERFFMYGEEADLCLRAKTLGVVPMVTPDATIVHFGGASETVRAEKILKLYRAKMQIMRKHWSPAAVAAGRVLMQVNVCRRFLLWSVLDRLAPARDGQRRGVFRELWRRRREWLDVVDPEIDALKRSLG